MSRSRVIRLALALAVLATAGVCLRGYVTDDTFIHLRYARNLSNDVTAVHISINDADAAKLKAKWQIWGDGTRLVIINSPYRSFLEPLLNYIDDIDTHRSQGQVLTIVVPQFIPQRPFTSFLHTRTAETLRKELLNRSNIVITEVPYQVE